MVGPAWSRFQGRTRRLAARRGAAMVLQLHLWLASHGKMMWYKGPWTRAFWCGQQPRYFSPSSEFFPTCTTSPMLLDFLACKPRSSNSGWDGLQDNGYSDGVLDACYSSMMAPQAYNGVFSRSPGVDDIEHDDAAYIDLEGRDGQLRAGPGNARYETNTGTRRDVIAGAVPTTSSPSVFRRAAEDMKLAMRSWTTDWKLIENASSYGASLSRLISNGMRHGLTPLIYAADSTCKLIGGASPLSLLVLLVLSLPACAAHAESDNLELVRTLPPAVLVQGGLVNGAAVDPLSFIMHQLAERFAALGEEVRLSAVTELLTFDRQGAETVDNIINRFDVVRQLAHDQGGAPSANWETSSPDTSAWLAQDLDMSDGGSYDDPAIGEHLFWAYQRIASTMPMYVAQPPPSLPAWALMPEFSFVQQPMSFVNPEQEPLIPLQDGRPSVRSTLEPTNAQLVDSLHAATEASTLRWLNKSQPARPAAQVTSQLHEVHHSAMESFVQAQRVMHERRAQAKRAQRALHLPRTDDLQAYDEPDTMCSLCQEEFGAGESVVRLVCRHLFHTHCWTSYLVHEEARMQCPNCRGSTRIIARFNYVSHSATGTPHPPASPGGSSNASRGGQGTQEYPLTPPGRTPDPSVHTPSPFRDANPAAGQDDAEYEDAQPTFPWWPAAREGAASAAVYHQATMLPGHNALLIDPGAHTNLVGLKWVQQMLEKAQRAGRMPSQSRLQEPLTVQGVGQGVQRCTWSVSMPICTPCKVDGQETVAQHAYESPIVDGSGANLPALLGLKSLRAKSAILVLSERDEDLRVILPGPGGVNIEATGAVEYPLTVAPSGHLLLICDAFAGHRRINLHTREMQFPVVSSGDGELEHFTVQDDFHHGLPAQSTATAMNQDDPPERAPSNQSPS
ncbi:HRD1B [Symbiodinium sp. CCMP2592]|nr:HRD1B [Symbiodinium sp. CCMP2592]